MFSGHRDEVHTGVEADRVVRRNHANIGQRILQRPRHSLGGCGAVIRPAARRQAHPQANEHQAQY